ncbi:MAG: hypothetical protein ACI9TI_001152 [Natronomonas sp.]|jgi:hypothetical protein
MAMLGHAESAVADSHGRYRKYRTDDDFVKRNMIRKYAGEWKCETHDDGTRSERGPRE